MGEYSLPDLAREIEFDVDEYLPLLRLFIDTTMEDLDRIRDGAVKKDNSTVSTAVHNIRGSSLNLGLDTISGLTDQLSTLNKKSFFTDIENIVRKCEAELSDLNKLLES